MIYLDLTGNLGNQMFIYACGRKLQETTKQPITLNTYNLDHKHPDYTFSLNIFVLNENVTVERKKKIPFYASHESLFYKIVSKIPFCSRFIKKTYYKIMSRFNIFVWDDISYIPINIANKDKDIYLSGFWQSPLYFDDIRNLILNDFVLKESNRSHISEFLNKIRNVNSVCVSIRRGDYLSNPIYKAKHYICTPTYFENCVEMIKRDLSSPILFLFSDDVDWVKQNINYDIETLYEETGYSLSQKILLMSACKNFILSNSSFSWWVEYLSSNDSKFVIAPSRWYANNSNKDVYQPYWHIINI